MAINLNSSFERKAGVPLDKDSVVADLTARDAILSGIRYEGLLVYVVAEKTNFQLVDGIDNSNWQELSGSGGASVPTSAQISLINNSTNTISEIGEYLTDYALLKVEYYLYRKNNSGFKSMTGVLYLESYPDELLADDQWKKLETTRSERGAYSGVTFSLLSTDTGKSVLVADLDDMGGTGHECIFYYTLTKLSVSSPKIDLINNSVNPITAIGNYLDEARCIIVNYYIYRRTDSGFKSMSGKVILEGKPDAISNPDKWVKYEPERSERGGYSGVTFSLDDIDTDKSILVATLDDMAGTNHECTMYYNVTELTT